MFLVVMDGNAPFFVVVFYVIIKAEAPIAAISFRHAVLAFKNYKKLTELGECLLLLHGMKKFALGKKVVNVIAEAL